MIDCSTISPQATREIAAKLAEKGVRFLDAPVSGGSEGAAKGTLTIMVGGEAADVERAMPVFQAMGKTITHVGAHGCWADGQAGQPNFGGGQLSGDVRSVALCRSRAGWICKRPTMPSARVRLAVGCLPTVRRRSCAAIWRPGFTIDLQQKDIRLVLEAADQLGVPLLGTSLIFNLYRTLQQMGMGEKGNHGLIMALENLAGIKVGKEG